jgi:hypothetical protein
MRSTTVLTTYGVKIIAPIKKGIKSPPPLRVVQAGHAHAG